MNKFEQIKRDPFVQEETAQQLFDFNIEFLEGEKSVKIYNDPNIDPNRKAGISRNRAGAYLENLILSYSTGMPISDILPLAKQTFAEFERHYCEYSDNGYKLKLWENNGYQYALWLLGLAYLLGLDDYIPKVATWISPEKKHGNDPLFAALFEQLGVSKVLPSADVLLHPKGYGDLWEIIQHADAEQEKQAVLMQSYIRHWYKKVIGKTVWKGYDEKDKGPIYFGFWSFEAGLVSVLYGLDDTAYREMTFYPKDLVDYARQLKSDN